ncbi:MAG: hypothetical protein LIP77_04120 [Planctomycetes bacterium]|nr:hypothetical protein [Planctomycetota bacterium]
MNPGGRDRLGQRLLADEVIFRFFPLQTNAATFPHGFHQLRVVGDRIIEAAGPSAVFVRLLPV